MSRYSAHTGYTWPEKTPEPELDAEATARIERIRAMTATLKEKYPAEFASARRWILETSPSPEQFEAYLLEVMQGIDSRDSAQDDADVRDARAEVDRLADEHSPDTAAAISLAEALERR